VAEARRLAAEVLEPAAQEVDRAPAVPAGHLRTLAGAGLLGLAGPPSHGGHGAPAAVVREVFEALAGACGATFFVWVQHHAPVRLLAGSPNTGLRDRLLPGLCAGRDLGGVAFAHLRRPGAPALQARAVPGGLRVDGEAPWVTSWGLADVVAVAARAGAGGDQVVFFALPARATAHVRPSPPLRLAAMSATCTVRLAFDDLRVSEADVISESSLADWQARDRVATAQPNAAVFGLAATAARLLAERDAGAAAALEEERADLRAQSYGLADEGREDDAHLARLVGLRARSLDLAVRAATALVAATGGRAMDLSHPAQRLLREAAFYTIQAQTRPLREATLARLVSRGS
jgi:alkylation response protein AidB-like acyl-CoA dehydrogenase